MKLRVAKKVIRAQTDTPWPPHRQSTLLAACRRGMKWRRLEWRLNLGDVERLPGEPPFVPVEW